MKVLLFIILVFLTSCITMPEITTWKCTETAKTKEGKVIHTFYSLSGNYKCKHEIDSLICQKGDTMRIWWNEKNKIFLLARYK